MSSPREETAVPAQDGEIPASKEELLVAVGISKSFGTVQALDDVSITLRRGEVHAILGENGAGKSTLVAILNGSVVQDAGRVVLQGLELEAGRRAPDMARRIATVYQDLMLVPSMTGLENIALALGLPVNRGTRDRVRAVQQTFGLDARMDTRVRDLELPEQQRIELIRALCQEPLVLLLDEPTSFLPPVAIESFLTGVRGLAQRGLGIVLITHRLDEARKVADRVTVLRKGRVVARYGEALPSNAELAMAMVGTRVVEPAQGSRPSEPTLIEAKNISVPGERGATAVESVSLTVRESEIVGVAGVDGNGQIEFLEALAGLRRVSAGSVWYAGRDVTGLSYAERSRHGIHFVSGDRRRYGIVPTFSVGEHFEYVLGAAIGARLPSVLVEFQVHPPNPFLRGDHLSGGNQQKLMMARACERHPRLLILTYPTSGLDVHASVNVRELLLRTARLGSAIVVASSDLDELLTICHRIVVMSRRRIVGEQELGHFDVGQLGRLFTGGDRALQPSVTAEDHDGHGTPLA